MCGDPPNIIIGTSLGYTFFDFLNNTGLIAGISLVVMILYFFLVYRKELITEEGMAMDTSKMPEPRSAIVNKKDFIISSIIFGVAVILLITHASTGFTVALIGALIAIVTLLAAGKEALRLLKKVDYKTLLFFIGLFIVVGGLEETGVLELIAEGIKKISGGDIRLVVIIIIGVSAVASAFIDNIPFAATMIPVIKALSVETGVPLNTLAWTLSIGTDIGGSATPIGASANVVGTSVSAKNGYPISWGKYCKTAAPATVIVIVISILVIFARYC